ncbi:DUF2441 domain-containing protein [Bacillus sp. GX]|uniref:DUF2441 domain-containing protein n=1 Tax=Bacillus TaxID=1386 RepID=UPI001009CE0F|nr:MULTISPECIES: DUF2441 domain-containing protein [Bacillus]RXJ20071.1 DUF2441 domain-containing protein [Bacillus albus]RXJ29852.1 DUF2441 domain-containing protein [Bacillus albus]RXJ31445.1 DUF2441 domain-containing protein [Bacillus albus]RXJ42668.1 DUF2441 domain-containing protein [Bacillus albus]RXJ59596.1 DUF2441 domain-containing protein [Bacillus albus]
MNEAAFYAYHIVTRRKMNIGQIIHFNKNQHNTLYHFFFEKEQLNASGEDGMKIINNHYKNEELHINNENAPVVMNYMDQTIRAIRETIVEMVRLRVIGSSFEGDGNLLPKEDGIPFSQKIEQAREYWKGNSKNELPELLINGKIEVVEIINDFSKMKI